MAKKSKSPYYFRTIKRTKVNSVKIALRAYQTRKGLIDEITKAEIPVNIFFYEVKSSDGGYKKVFDIQTAQTAFEQMIEFEKRQMIIKED